MVSGGFTPAVLGFTKTVGINPPLALVTSRLFVNHPALITSFTFRSV